MSKKGAQHFVELWKDRGNENEDTQKFWISFYRNVLDVPHAEEIIQFERPVRGANSTTHDGFIDVFVPSSSLLVEQKSYGIDLDKKEPRQGKMVTPVEQAYAYVQGLPDSEKPRYVLTCNFTTFRIYDRSKDPMCRQKPALEFSLEQLPANVSNLMFLVSGGGVIQK